MAEALGLAVNCLTIIDLSAKIASTLYTYSREVSTAKTEISRIRNHVVGIGEVSQSLHDLLEQHGRAGRQLGTFGLIQNGVSATEDRLSELLGKLDAPSATGPTMRRFGLRALKWPFSQREVEGIIGGLEDSMRLLSQSLQVDQTSILLNAERRLLLESLPHADEAAFDSRVEDGNPRCHPQTRFGILSDVSQWVAAPESKNVFWLNGMAGTGKSTISRTLCGTFSRDGSLAASFFFKKGESNRGNCNRFFTTIAYQLALKEPAFAVALGKSMDADPSLVSKPLQEQWNSIVLGPLERMALPQRRVFTLVIVIDALDECENDDDIRLLIHLLSGASWHPLPWRLKAFITSRPELPIRLGFGAVRGTFQDLILHEVPTQIVRGDLDIFVRDELARIKRGYNDSVPEHRRLRDESWPDEGSIRRIVDLAAPLFVFASTVCRFVSDRRGGNPERQLRRFLDYKTHEQASQLEAIYLPILEQQIAQGPSDESRSEALADFQQIVGTIVTLFSPLPASSLASLLRVEESLVEDRLDLLYSVLQVPSIPHKPVRLLHLSFRDFLTDPRQEASSPFWIDTRRRHKVIAYQCITVMDRLLRKNTLSNEKDIFEWKYPERRPDGRQIPPEFRYACLYWIRHLKEGSVRLRDGYRVHSFLDKHILHWAEVVCTSDPPFDILGAWRELGLLIHDSKAVRLRAFHADAHRIFSSNLNLITTVPSTIYSTMLMFAPRSSLIRQRYADEVPGWVTIGWDAPKGWGSLLTAFDCRWSTSSICFSPNSRYIALISANCYLSVRDISTGCVSFSTYLSFAAGHRSNNKVSFSYDSAYLAVGGDGFWYLYRPETGQRVQKFTLTGLWALSTDSLHLAIEKDSGRQTEIYALGEGLLGSQVNLVHVLSTSFPIEKMCMNLSQSYLTFASINQQHEAIVWRVDISNPEAIPVYNGVDHVPDVIFKSERASQALDHEQATAVVLSPNLRYIAIILPGRLLQWRVEVHEVETRTRTQIFETDMCLNDAVVFSPDSRVVARDSGSGTINIRQSVDDGGAPAASVAQLNFRGNTAVAFSHDASLMATSLFGSVHLWNLRDVKPEPDTPVTSHTAADGTTRLLHPKASDPITWLKISPDSTIVAVGMHRGHVQIWDPAALRPTMTLQGHMHEIMFGLFSTDTSALLSIDKSLEVRLWELLFDGQCSFRTYIVKETFSRFDPQSPSQPTDVALIKDLPSLPSLKSPPLVSGHSGLGLEDFGRYGDYTLVGGLTEFHAASRHLAVMTHSRSNWVSYLSVWRFRSRHGVGWDKVLERDLMDLAMAGRDPAYEFQIINHFTQDGRYIITALTDKQVCKPVVVVQSLTTGQKLGTYVVSVRQARVSFLDIVRGFSSHPSPCRCPVYTVALSTYEEDTGISVHLCICSSRKPGGPPDLGEPQLSFRQDDDPPGYIDVHENEVRWRRKRALILPQGFRPKRRNQKLICDKRFGLLAMGTTTDEVLLVKIDKDHKS